MGDSLERQVSSGRVSPEVKTGSNEEILLILHPQSVGQEEPKEWGRRRYRPPLGT